MICIFRNRSACPYILSVRNVPPERAFILIFSPRKRQRTSSNAAKRRRPPSLAPISLLLLLHCKTYTAMMTSCPNKPRCSPCLTTHVAGYPPVSHPSPLICRRLETRRRISTCLIPVLHYALTLVHPRKNVWRYEMCGRDGSSNLQRNTRRRVRK
jgi:hypothetical protein